MMSDRQAARGNRSFRDLAIVCRDIGHKRDRTLTPWTLLLRGDRVESVTLTVVFTAASLGVPLSDMLAAR